ncbi:DUF2079 domain-containing protein [Actinoallomurus vinaceus]|uniref:DUF2079 domain-containing protein n=1 Tax=Actinoallomurus vinaceus TaxID=1080074 RepID=UPI0031E52D79
MTYSIVRHAHAGTAGYDLGIFDQAVRGYAHFRAPVVALKGPGFNLLGDHFHPILMLLAPFYRVWPDARMLLVAQALLIAVSIVPILRFAERRLGTARGVAVAVAYGLSWGIQGAVAFDFHEVAFAVPILAFALTALADGRLRASAAWSLALLFVKEDMGLTVAAIGVLVMVRRRWRLGAALTVTGLVTSALVILVVIPSFNPHGEYRYWNAVGSQSGGLLHTAMVDPGGKLLLLAYVAGVTAFVALRSPLALVAVPSLAYRLASDNPLYWSTQVVHYNAILMPIMFVAFVDGVGRLEADPRPYARRCARLAVPAVLLIAVALVPSHSFRHLYSPRFYRTPPSARDAHRILPLIPDGARVAAGNYLAPQLTDRCDVVLFPNVNHVPVDWVVVDITRMSGVPAPPDQQEAALNALPSQGFRRIAQKGGIVLFRRT